MKNVSLRQQLGGCERSLMDVNDISHPEVAVRTGDKDYFMFKCVFFGPAA